MIVNPSMVVLAREFRGFTQEELARRMFVSQARIAKLESGVNTDLQNAQLELLCDALEFPAEFFGQEEELIGFGSSAYFYRKKADLTAADRRRIHGVVNLLRINIKKMLSHIDIDPSRALPRLDIEDYGGSAEQVAQAVRAMWNMPEGPVKNLTGAIESAGVIVVPCNFYTRSMDATSLRLTEMPPLIFINSEIPGDRWRFTLAHELAHIVMHDVPREEMENEADRFAAELLMPELEMRAQFARIPSLRLQDLANLKPYWKASMGALLKRAGDLGFLSENQTRYLWSSMSKLGFRTKEPNPIPREDPKTYQKVVRFFTETLEYSQEELSKTLKLSRPLLDELHGAILGASVPPRLRIVS